MEDDHGTGWVCLAIVLWFSVIAAIGHLPLIPVLIGLAAPCCVGYWLLFRFVR